MLGGRHPEYITMIVEGVLGLGGREQRPLQWPRISLLTQGTLLIRIGFVRQRSNPTLEQKNKQQCWAFIIEKVIFGKLTITISCNFEVCY